MNSAPAGTAGAELFHSGYSIHLAALRLIAVEADVACTHDRSKVVRGFPSPQHCTAARRDALRLCAHSARSAAQGGAPAAPHSTAMFIRIRPMRHCTSSFGCLRVPRSLRVRHASLRGRPGPASGPSADIRVKGVHSDSPHTPTKPALSESLRTQPDPPRQPSARCPSRGPVLRLPRPCDIQQQSARRRRR